MNIEERWYAVDKVGIATLCKDQADALEEAEQGALSFPHLAPYCATRLLPIDADGGLDVCEELRQVLRWEEKRMGSVSAGVLKSVIARIESMTANGQGNGPRE